MGCLSQRMRGRLFEMGDRKDTKSCAQPVCGEESWAGSPMPKESMCGP